MAAQALSRNRVSTTLYPAAVSRGGVKSIPIMRALPSVQREAGQRRDWRRAAWRRRNTIRSPSSLTSSAEPTIISEARQAVTVAGSDISVLSLTDGHLLRPLASGEQGLPPSNPLIEALRMRQDKSNPGGLNAYEPESTVRKHHHSALSSEWYPGHRPGGPAPRVGSLSPARPRPGAADSAADEKTSVKPDKVSTNTKTGAPAPPSPTTPAGRGTPAKPVQRGEEVIGGHQESCFASSQSDIMIFWRSKGPGHEVPFVGMVSPSPPPKMRMEENKRFPPRYRS